MNQAQIQARIDALQLALASGHSEVEVDGQRMRYRSVEQLEKAIRHFSALLRKAKAGQNAPRANPHGFDARPARVSNGLSGA